jgi:hypothetical protein
VADSVEQVGNNSKWIAPPIAGKFNSSAGLILRLALGLILKLALGLVPGSASPFF